MTQRIGSLTWVAYALPDNPVAFVNCDFLVDQTWDIATVGSLNDSGLEAKVVTINNLANASGVALLYGPFQYAIPAYSKKSYYIPLNTRRIVILGTTGQVQVTFWIEQLNPQDDGDNALAIQIAGASATAGLNSVSLSSILNSNMDIWSDGINIPVAATATYGPEGWYAYRTGGVAGARLAQVTGFNGARWYNALSQDPGDASLAALFCQQSMLSLNSKQYQGQIVTLSFDIITSAAFTGATVDVSLISGTGTDQNLSTGFAGQTVVASQSFPFGPSQGPTRLSITGTVGVAINQLGISFGWTPTVVGPGPTPSGFNFGRVQIDPGSSAQTYRTPPSDVEQLRALEFFQLINEVPAGGCYLGIATATDAFNAWLPLMFSRKRAIPTIIPSTVSWGFTDGISLFNSSGFTAGNIFNDRALMSASFGAGGLTQFRPYAARGSGQIRINARL